MTRPEVSIEILRPGEYAASRDALLRVRHAAYASAGLAAPAAPPCSTEDEYDQDAWFVVARHAGDLVGALRVHAHPRGERWEFERWFEFPEEFPPKSVMAEISKVCVRPERRWVGLSRPLFRGAAEVVRALERRWILGCSAERLFPLYARAGCQPTSVRFLHPRTKEPSLAFVARVDGAPGER